jgi:hypothetical protein
MDRIDHDRELLPTTNVNTQPAHHQLQQGPIENNPPANNPPTNNPVTLNRDPAGPRPYLASSSIEKLEDGTLSVPELHHDDGNGYVREPRNNLTPLTHARLPADFQRPLRSRTMETQNSPTRRSGIDWIVPIDERVRLP